MNLYKFPMPNIFFLAGAIAQMTYRHYSGTWKASTDFLAVVSAVNVVLILFLLAINQNKAK